VRIYSSKSAPAKVLCGLLKQIDPELKALNVEEQRASKKTVAELKSN